MTSTGPEPSGCDRLSLRNAMTSRCLSSIGHRLAARTGAAQPTGWPAPGEPPRRAIVDGVVESSSYVPHLTIAMCRDRQHAIPQIFNHHANPPDPGLIDQVARITRA